MKAILIDSKTKTVSEITLDNSSNPIANALECELFTAPIIYDNEDTLYCDDEALISGKEVEGAFMYENWNTPILNKAIILGGDDEGNSLDVKRTIEEAKKGLHFIDKNNPSLVNYVSQFR
jgi:hypothetical protein